MVTLTHSVRLIIEPSSFIAILRVLDFHSYSIASGIPLLIQVTLISKFDAFNRKLLLAYITVFTKGVTYPYSVCVHLFTILTMDSSSLEYRE